MLTDGISTLEERSPEVVLEPNATYWDPSRKPSVRIVYDNAIAKADALRSIEAGDGKIDIVMDVTLEEAKAFNGGGNGAIVANDAKTVLIGVFNERKQGSPWRDVELRRALNMALDRQAIIDQGAGGYGISMPALIQPGRYGSDPALAAYGLDVDRAAEVIGRADIPGKEVLVLVSQQWSPVAEVIAECLSKVGLTAKLHVMASGEEVEPEGWDIKLVWYFDWSPSFPVGVVHREFFGKDGQFRATAEEDATFDGLYQRLLKTPHEPAQEEVVKEVERYVHGEARALFLFSPNTLFAVSSRVEITPYDTCMSELAETRIKAQGA